MPRKRPRPVDGSVSVSRSRVHQSDEVNGVKMVALRNAADPLLGAKAQRREEEEVRLIEEQRAARLKALEGHVGEEEEEEEAEDQGGNQKPRTANAFVAPDLSSVLKKAQEAAGLCLSAIPTPVLETVDLELAVWSALVDDDCLRKIARINKHKMENGVKAGSQIGSASLNHKAGALALMSSLFQGASEREKEELVVPFDGITSLIIPNAEKLTDNGLLNLAVTCTSLRRLDVAGCLKISDVSIRALAKQNPGLEELDLSTCPRVAGAGLVTVGECCHKLKVLKLRNCPASEEWLLKRIATGLPNLRELDLTYSLKVTDETLRTIANRCNLLEKVVLAHCPEISDVGILALSEHCHGLEYLDLTRAKLKHKITDVCMLSLAERCVCLSTLLLSGNELITNVGLSWLASGCHALEKLDLGQLFKVTDGGLRAIGDGCPELAWLNISGLHEVSDVGMRNLASGCRKLRFLNCSNVYLLTDGVQRDFGVEGLQYLFSVCSELEHLVLNGCFQFGPNLVRRLSEGIDPLTELKSLKLGHALKTLSVSRVPKMSAQSLQWLLGSASGPTLVTLNLAQCEEVRDKVLQLIGKHCASLRSLNVSKCAGITTRGVNAMCRGKQAKTLRDLDLSFCPEINDLALLALSEAGLRPGLARLSVKGCARVSETGVAWLSESLLSLMEINLKGCEGVSLRGLKAIAGNWPYVQVRNDFEFFGIFPQPKCRDMRFIDEYGSVWKAAILIQNTFRAKKARQEHALRRERYLMNWTARKLQAYWRARVARRYVIVKRMQRNKEIEAAILVQKCYRCRKARQAAEAARERRYREQCERAALLVQTKWRGKMARNLLKAHKQLKEEHRKKCEAAAIKMQRIWRGLEGRKQFRLFRQMRLARQAEEEAAASRMQGLFRGRNARKRLAERKRREQGAEEARHMAAMQIQARMRGRLARKQLARFDERKQERIDAVIRVQCMWRSRKGKLAVHLIRQARMHEATERAALKVQCAYRARKGRLAAHMIRVAQAESAAADQASALKLQCMFRAKVSRRRLHKLRSDKLDIARRQKDLEGWAAVLVQKAFRGKQGRKRARIFREERMKRWKSMFDYEQDRPFYYNQDTGEVRWRMPQDLLDLLPKPACSNCEDAAAYVECGDCKEFFCEKCWGEVHFGGLRAKHDFRALFDAYGKRVDYGDGEWPSIWPTEIEQDDKIGWQRVKRQEQVEKGEPITIGIPGLDESESKLDTYASTLSTTRAPGVGDSDSFPSSSDDEDNDNDDEEEEVAKLSAGQSGSTQSSQRWRRLWDYENEVEIYIDQVKRRLRFERPRDFESPREEDCWKEYWDDTYEVAYFHNTKTGESTYERPDALLSEDQTKQKKEDQAWVKNFGEDGRAYFFNTVTSVSLFERPAAYHTPREEAAKEAAKTNPNWSRYLEEDTRLPFFYNHATRQSQYDRPPDYTTPRGPVWRKFFDEATGRDYYVDEATDKGVQYMRPGGYHTPRPAGYEEGANGWIKYADESLGGAMVYQNTVTGQVTDVRPADFFAVEEEDLQGAAQWTKHWDEAEQKWWFLSSRTGEATFDRPDDYLSEDDDNDDKNKTDSKMGSSSKPSVDSSLDRMQKLAVPLQDEFEQDAELASGAALAVPLEDDSTSWMTNDDWTEQGIVKWLLAFKDQHPECFEIKTPLLRPEVRERVMDECDKLDLENVTQGFGKLRSILISRPIESMSSHSIIKAKSTESSLPSYY